MKWKTKKYHPLGTIPKSNIKIVERGKIYTTNTQIHGRSLSWLEPTIYRTQGEQASHYTTDAVMLTRH
jgi:hypothetical protein